MPLRQGYASLLSPPNTVAVTTDTTAAVTDLVVGTHSAPSDPLEIPAYYLKTGHILRTEAWGTFSTTGTPTLLLGVYYGTTALATNVSPGFTTASGAATLPWHLRCITHIRSAATASAVVTITQGELWYGTTLTATTQIPVPGVALATTNIDNTAANVWTVKGTWSASSASNIVVLHAWSVEELYTP